MPRHTHPPKRRRRFDAEARPVGMTHAARRFVDSLCDLRDSDPTHSRHTRKATR